MDYAALKTEGYNPKTANIDKVSSLEIAEIGRASCRERV